MTEIDSALFFFPCADSSSMEIARYLLARQIVTADDTMSAATGYSGKENTHTHTQKFKHSGESFTPAPSMDIFFLLF